MKAASAQEIKEQLKDQSKQELIAICLRLARFKKENKELLDYLLLQSHDLEGYIRLVKQETEEGFGQVNTSSVYLGKKTLRKVLRNCNKHIRYTGSKTAEVEILLHYLRLFQALPPAWLRTKVLHNIYEAQVKKVGQAIGTLHEDLQFDYRKELDGVLENNPLK